MKQLIQLLHIHIHEHDTTGSGSTAYASGILSPSTNPTKLQGILFQVIRGQKSTFKFGVLFGTRIQHTH